MEVIEVMKNDGISLGSVVAIYEECSFLSHNFTEVLFSHCPSPREVDMAAHVLVSHLEGSQSIIWIEEPSDYLSGGLKDDVAVNILNIDSIVSWHKDSSSISF
jgi:hypothetical protein